MDRFQDMPPKTRRLVKVGTYSATPVIILGIVSAMFIDYRLVGLAIVSIAIAVFLPLGIAASREKHELARQQRDQERDP